MLDLSEKTKNSDSICDLDAIIEQQEEFVPANDMVV